MNLNVLRTIFATVATALTGIMTFAPKILGCVAIVGSDKFDCAASWLPPTYAAGTAFVLYAIALFLKAVGQGGGVVQNLTAPSVVVTPEGKPGTVTPAQVASSK